VVLHVWSSARYSFPLPGGHRFPISKYALLRDRVIADGLVPLDCVHEPAPVSRDDLLLVHQADYVDRFTAGKLTSDEVRRLGFPWSPALVERSYRSTAGTCDAARWALDHGVAMNLAGGTHHAFSDHGEGFCVFNDVAVAIRVLQSNGRIERAAIVDLDVHQGNGTHAIFAGDERVFTLSIHGGKNYPFHRVAGVMDIDLPDQANDALYMRTLESVLPSFLSGAAPDIVMYLAGADPYVGDRLGRMALTLDGLARRDRYVLETCRDVGLPVAIVLGGGYAADIAETVQCHVNTVMIARDFA
jgi:acetoin utilization deacetylase AcuC-like enzyme